MLTVSSGFTSTSKWEPLRVLTKIFIFFSTEWVSEKEAECASKVKQEQKQVDKNPKFSALYTAVTGANAYALKAECETRAVECTLDFK